VVDRPNALWVADLTYLRCWEGIVFFAFVLDACSRRVVGWQLASHMCTTLVLDALRMALGTREHGADLQLTHHSDAGSQYTSFDYTQALDDDWVLASIGTVGDCYDNALAESFVDSFKTADLRPRVALTGPARARHRRVHRLVQHRTPALLARLPHPRRGRNQLARAGVRTWSR
jgi:transposase InsO family protein